MAANLRLKLKKPGRIQTFDDSDLSEYNSSSDGSSLRAPAVKSQAVLPRSVPNHLLLISILEQLCIMYSDDSRQAQDIFKSLCGQLTNLNVVSPLLVMDEMSSLRTQYRQSVHRMLVAAIHKSKKGMFTSLLPFNGFGQGYLPALQNKIPSQPTMSPDDMVNQTSRYNAEFVEVEKLGKGGFGAVYKSRNKLDGKLYAVKKVKFKHAKPEVWFRVLREVKALASLQHYNIVGYNAAWLEYGSAIMSKSSSGDHFDNIPSLENNLSSSANDTSVIFQDSSSSDDHITGDVVTFDKRVRWGSGPKIKELLNTDSSETDSLSPDRIAANPPRLLKMFNRNNSHHDIGSFKNVTEFFDTADFATLNTLESHSEFDSNFGSQSGVDGDYCEVVKIKHEKTEFTLDSAAMSMSSQITDAHVTRDRRKNVKRSGIRRSISCDPLASGEIILQEEDTKDIHNFTEESFPLKKSVTLYIQMELCSHTLWEWMKTRNEMCQSEDEFMTYKDRNMAIFRQILKAVEYIHSQGVIHRDLKPRNIFLREEGLHIKVGDFGLATEDVFSPIYDEPITFSSSPTKLFRTGSTLSDHTSGVGTSTYAAPEQLVGSAYNTKCDIYSLGVILFELFQKYSTEMERYRSLEDLRKGIIPDTVYKNWPVEAHYIELMICEFPEKRPSAKEMLNGELFLSKDQVISDMKTQELTYKTEIERLKKLLSQRDKIIAERDKTIEELIEHGVSSQFVGTSV